MIRLPRHTIVAFAALLLPLASLAAKPPSTADAPFQTQLRRATSAVGEIEPLSAPRFIRTDGSGLNIHRQTQEVTVTYKVAPKARTTAEALRTAVVRSCQQKGWSYLPDDTSAPVVLDGDVRRALTFRAPAQPSLGDRPVQQAYFWIAGDLASIRCLYVFRSLKQAPTD